MNMKHIFLSLCALALVAGSGCEDDDDDDSSQSEMMTQNGDNAAMNPPGGSDTDSELLGVWKGTAGSSQVKVTVELTFYDVIVSMPVSGIPCGTVTWANGDTREIVDALYEPPDLILYPSGSGTSDRGDEVWNLTYDGTSLSGTGTKTDGSTYDVNLTR